VDAVAGANAAISSADRLVAQEDAALVAGAKTGNARAFELIVQRHERKIFLLAQRVTRNREDAEDAVQQSFQKAFIHLQKFEGESSFSTWLTRIAINEALTGAEHRHRVGCDNPSCKIKRPWNIEEISVDCRSKARLVCRYIFLCTMNVSVLFITRAAFR
jgi:Sigma-70 region 2